MSVFLFIALVYLFIA